MGNWTSWELSAGMFPGLLLGIRSYDDGDFQVDHVLYIPFIDISLEIYK